MRFIISSLSQGESTSNVILEMKEVYLLMLHVRTFNMHEGNEQWFIEMHFYTCICNPATVIQFSSSRDSNNLL